MRSEWSREAILPVRRSCPSAVSAASSRADLTWAEATGSSYSPLAAANHAPPVAHAHHSAVPRSAHRSPVTARPRDPSADYAASRRPSLPRRNPVPASNPVNRRNVVPELPQSRISRGSCRSAQAAPLNADGRILLFDTHTHRAHAGDGRQAICSSQEIRDCRVAFGNRVEEYRTVRNRFVTRHFDRATQPPGHCQSHRSSFVGTPLRSNTFQIRNEVACVAYFRALTPKAAIQEPPHGIHNTGH